MCRDSSASILSGIWLHRQQADDLSSADDDCVYSEEDDPEAAAESVPRTESSCQFLDRADIAVFDTLLSVPSEDAEPSSPSNVELLSMLAVGDVPSVSDTAEVPRCDGTGCDSGLLKGDETDGVGTSDLNETLVANNDVSSNRPQTGSVINSGTGDLTMSPVHHVTNAASSIQATSFPNTHGLLPKSKVTSRPWKSDAGSLSSNEETRYIVEAAELISQAQEHEIGENFPAAYSHYRSGIEILVKGVQSRHFHYWSHLHLKTRQN